MIEKNKKGPALADDSFVAVALQPRIYGCRNKDDINKNLENQLQLIDNSYFNGPLAGGGPVKLIALPEHSISGAYDETSHMDQEKFCKEVAITIPGPEIDKLCEKAQAWGTYIVGQAKVVDPEIIKNRYFNMAYIISPSGDIILKHTKNIIGVVEGTTSPWDVWDRWKKKYGEGLEAYYPVVKTDIGNLAVVICAETIYAETFRALALQGAEVVVKMTFAEPYIADGHWECANRIRAWENIFYLVCPNNGQYYMDPDVDHAYNLMGGNSMIVDYMGRVMAKTDTDSVGCAPAELNIRALRRYRERAPQATMMVQMRSDLWKQIYERWPSYPKNLYMEKTYSHVLDRHALHLELLEKFFEAGIYTRSE